MITFLHFSDFHIPQRKGELKDGIDPCERIEKMIEIARELDVDPSFSIITGDISDNGTVQGYKIAKEYISEIEELGGPVLPAIGNVDDRSNFRRILLEDNSLDVNGSCYYSKTIGGLHVIILDSQTPGTENGSFDKEQLAWLEEELLGNPKPSIISFHHPTFELPLPPDAKMVMFDPAHARIFREIVSEGNVLAILCGHLHQSLVISAGGIHYIVGGSTVSELSIKEKEKGVYEASGFNVLTYTEKILMIRPVTYSEGRKLIRKIPMF